ncbi:hypothetical protein GQ54DRAFT_324289 [Martensiomyces pterosporus]|nr:hypothetical protein GQ54DRAFT_324289 [Martensiomyces pterosporus]
MATMAAVAGEDPAWAPGSRNRHIRTTAAFALYGIYTTVVVVTMVLFLIQSRNRHSGLSQRSVMLVMLQAIGCFLVGTDGLVSTAVGSWACFGKLWLFNVGFVWALAAISARAFQLIVVSKIHHINAQLPSYHHRLEQQQKVDSLDPIMARSGVVACSDVLTADFSAPILSVGDSASDNATAAGDKAIDMLGRQPTSCMALPMSDLRVNDNKTRASVSGTFLTSSSEAKLKLLRQHQRYLRFQAYATDRAMAIYIAMAVAVAVVISAAINIANKDYSLRPVGTNCEFIWGFIPGTIIIVIYLFILYPILLAKAWRLNDAYGIKTDLIICDTVGIAGLVVTLVWELKLHALRYKWSGMFFMWTAALFIHISSVIVPLWRSTSHSRAVARKLHRASVLEATTATAAAPQTAYSSRSGLVRGGGRRLDFTRMLDSPYEYQRFRDFSATCFCSELTAFVDEYQFLKAATIRALAAQAEESHGEMASPLRTPSSMVTIADKRERSTGIQFDVQGSFVDDSTSRSIQVGCMTSAMVSILDTVRQAAAHPQQMPDERTPLPPVLVDKLATIFSVYIDPNSYASINAPPIMVRRIKDRMNRGQVCLTILDEVKDEVLFMLYADVFTRYVNSR